MAVSVPASTVDAGLTTGSRWRPPNVPNPALAGIRGLAALAVLLFHVGSQRPTPDSDPLLTGLPAAWISPLAIVAVGIFIGMSGFFLFHPLSLAHMQGSKHRPLDFYLARRLGRIFPPYWVALIAYVVLFGYPLLSGAEWIPVLTLTHVFDPELANIGLYVSWTLSVEVTFYLFLPVLAWALRKRWPAATTTVHQRFRAQLVVVACVYLTGLLARTIVLAGPDSWQNATKYMLFNFLDGFGGGMLFAVLLSWRKLGNPLPSWMEWLVKHPWVCLVFAVEIYWVGTTLGFPPGLELQGLPPFRLMLFAASLLLIIPLLCLPGIFDEHGTSAYHRVFGSTVLLWLGGISYGVYLWNLPWTQKIAEWQAQGWVAFGPDTLAVPGVEPADGWFRIDAEIPQGFWPLLIMVLVGTVVAAAVSYFTIEKPIMAAVKRFFISRGVDPARLPDQGTRSEPSTAAASLNVRAPDVEVPEERTDPT